MTQQEIDINEEFASNKLSELIGTVEIEIIINDLSNPGSEFIDFFYCYFLSQSEFLLASVATCMLSEWSNRWLEIMEGLVNNLSYKRKKW